MAPRYSGRMQSMQPAPATRAELRHGAVVAWLTFMALLIVTVVVASVVGEMTADEGPGPLPLLPIILFYTVILGGAVSGVLTLASVPAASRFERALPPHMGDVGRVAAFACLGAVVGLIGAVSTSLLTVVAGNDPFAVFSSPVTLLALALTAAATAVGRAAALHRARRTTPTS